MLKNYTLKILENLATQAVQEELYSVLNDVISMVNIIQSRAHNSRMFSTMCNEMRSKYTSLLYRSEVRWLSRGKILSQVISQKLKYF